MPNGFARTISKNGHYYIGQFKNNKRHGKGKWVNYDGRTKDGIWYEDEF